MFWKLGLLQSKFRTMKLVSCFTGLLLCILGSTPNLSGGQVLDPEKLKEIDSAIESAIAEGAAPGGVFYMEHSGASYFKAYGLKSKVPTETLMTRDTIFDMASLTKVVATTSSVMKLIELGRLELDSPVAYYLSDFTGGGKEKVTIRHLMTHTSGLKPILPRTPFWTGQDAAYRLCVEQELTAEPGTSYRYSDINFILLGELIERVSGEPFEDFVQEQIFQPLGMRDTGFLPPAEKIDRIAPTEYWRGRMLHGEVHDPSANQMEGVAGHAGLFSTALDLARFARMLLNEGELNGVRVFQPETVRLMTRTAAPAASGVNRGLGWDIDSAYSSLRGPHFPVGSFGHTGWTGGCLWVDPFSKTFYIFLSSRVHPDGQGNVVPLRKVLGKLAAEAVIGVDWEELQAVAAKGAEKTWSQPHVLNGIDTLVKSGFAPLKGMKVGLITNHTGKTWSGQSAIDLFHESEAVDLVALFSPEHGIRGELDSKVSDGQDEKTGLPIYSLYGETRIPKPEQLAGLDALVFDIQDIGCRFYTYISTMGNCMQAASQNDLKFFVLDRVNPISGDRVAGPLLEGETDFVGYHPIPIRHGMTVGELARLMLAEKGWELDLQVVPVEGWSRSLWLDETGLPWVNPSPNMRNLTQATLYPGIGILETTNLSVGRGTDTPFEIIGAPYIDGIALANELNGYHFPGIRFLPTRFTPDSSKFKNESCGGIQILLTDRDICPVIEVGVTIGMILNRDYPEDFGIDKFNRLLKKPSVIEGAKAGKDGIELRSIWTTEVESFLERREPFLIY